MKDFLLTKKLQLPSDNTVLHINKYEHYLKPESMTRVNILYLHLKWRTHSSANLCQTSDTLSLTDVADFNLATFKDLQWQFYSQAFL